MLYVSLFVELLRSRPRWRSGWRRLRRAAVDARAGAVLCRAAGRPAARAGGRTRIPARHLSRPAARLLARRARLRSRRPQPVRRLSALAGLRGRHLLGGVRARPLDRRRAARGAGGAADGRRIAAFTVPTPEFGPVILTMPLWALILLHYWRAVGEERRAYWLALAIEIGLLLLTTYAGPDPGRAAGAVHARQRARARASLRSYDPWIAAGRRASSSCFRI